jgi:hypothetical protein
MNLRENLSRFNEILTTIFEMANEGDPMHPSSGIISYVQQTVAHDADEPGLVDYIYRLNMSEEETGNVEYVRVRCDDTYTSKGYKSELQWIKSIEFVKPIEVKTIAFEKL